MQCLWKKATYISEGKNPVSGRRKSGSGKFPSCYTSTTNPEKEPCLLSALLPPPGVCWWFVDEKGGLNAFECEWGEEKELLLPPLPPEGPPTPPPLNDAETTTTIKVPFKEWKESFKVANKHFCKLDKFLRNFCSRYFFVSVTVYEMFGFEFF